MWNVSTCPQIWTLSFPCLTWRTSWAHCQSPPPQVRSGFSLLNFSYACYRFTGGIILKEFTENSRVSRLLLFIFPINNQYLNLSLCKLMSMFFFLSFLCPQRFLWWHGGLTPVVLAAHMARRRPSVTVPTATKMSVSRWERKALWKGFRSGGSQPLTDTCKSERSLLSTAFVLNCSIPLHLFSSHFYFLKNKQALNRQLCWHSCVTECSAEK